MNIYNQAMIPPGMLSRVIQDKRQKIAYYNQLHKMTTNAQDIEFINSILFDEANHLYMFTNLYTDSFGEKPIIAEPEDIYISSFIYGVKNSIKIELSSYEFYGNVFFSDSNPSVREIFMRALMDENRHAAKYNFIYTQLLENKKEKGSGLYE